MAPKIKSEDIIKALKVFSEPIDFEMLSGFIMFQKPKLESHMPAIVETVENAISCGKIQISADGLYSVVPEPKDEDECSILGASRSYTSEVSNKDICTEFACSPPKTKSRKRSLMSSEGSEVFGELRDGAESEDAEVFGELPDGAECEDAEMLNEPLDTYRQPSKKKKKSAMSEIPFNSEDDGEKRERYSARVKKTGGGGKIPNWRV